ncbi:radical SAM domain protein [Peptostreptococcaceae bacterium oral taxon 113 str. W5053]|nr:radical SAM domain protein [Peptostreptococcaceae bacterium oral taxon 113 str. W5053]
MSKLKLNADTRWMKIKGIPIIGNTKTSSIIGLDEKGYSLVKEIEKSGLDLETMQDENSELVNALIEGGYFNNIKSKIESAYLHVTHRCNLHCLGCYSYEDMRNDLLDLDTEMMKHILDELKSVGVDNLVISGGEPFLRQDLLEILRYAKLDLSISNISLITNGTILDIDWEEVKKYIDLLSFSLDSYKDDISFIRDEGIFNKIIKNIEESKKYLPTNIIVTIHKKNIDSLEEYKKLTDKLNVSMNISLFVAKKDEVFKDYILDSSDYEKLSEVIMTSNISILDSSIEGQLGCRESCGAGKSIISVDANGNVTPCHLFYEKEFILGNIQENGLAKILNNSKLNPVVAFTVEDIDDCQQCEYNYLCGAGCRYRSYCTKGSISSVDPVCGLYKAYFNSFFKSL